MITPTKSLPAILKSTELDPPTLSSANIFLSLLKGAITSGLLDAPAYSPTCAIVFPYTIPPSANFGIDAKLAPTAATPAPIAAIFQGKGNPAPEAIALAYASDPLAAVNVIIFGNN